MNHVKAWEEPDYPHGNWVDEKRWQSSGVEEIFEDASDLYAEDFEGLEEGYFAVYSENDLGSERIIPLEYNGKKFETVNGVFDSNTGCTQRYTAWRTSYSEKDLMEDIQKMDGKLIDLDENQAEVLEDLGHKESFNTYDTVVAAITGFYPSGLFHRS